MAANLQRQIIYRIRGKGRGWTFSARHFLDLGGRDAIDKALSRLTRQELIRRVGRGIYDYPRISPKLGVLSPSIDAAAREIAIKNDSKLKITGPNAANALGLTTQIPAKIVYLTDGPSRQIKIGNQTIQLKHTSPRVMATAGEESGLVIEALKYVGNENVDQSVIEKIERALSEQDKKELRKHIISAPDWMRPVIAEIVK